MNVRVVAVTGIICASTVLTVWNFHSHIAYVFSQSHIITSPSPVTAPVSTDITVGWVGDMVPSDISTYNAHAFTAVAPTLALPTLLIGNLEGTFAQSDRISKCVYIATQCHAFRGDAGFADELKKAGFDVVSLVNNHSYDFGSDGLADTTAELDRAGIAYISPTKPTLSITIQEKKIGILGLSSTPPAQTITDYDFIVKNVTELKASHDYVIVIFHGGSEGSDKTALPYTEEYFGTENRGDVVRVAHTAIDAGADMVLGSGPHVLRTIENYRGKTIAYSLGNFIGGGRLVTRGTLGLSGVFIGNLSTATHQFISILLSPDGIPSLDPTEQSRQLLETLK